MVFIFSIEKHRRIDEFRRIGRIKGFVFGVIKGKLKIKKA
jgi:hypothetical protein